MLFAICFSLLGCGKEVCDDCDSSSGGGTSFSSIRDEILLPSCAFSSCHGSGTGGLTLDDAGAYDALVNAKSVGAPGEILVIPGDADGSYLVKKLEDAEGIVGDEMPPSQLLDASTVARVRAWIDAGAPND